MQGNNEFQQRGLDFFSFRQVKGTDRILKIIIDFGLVHFSSKIIKKMN